MRHTGLHKQVNEDLKKQLNLSVFMLGLMKSGKPWEDVVGQK